jgi:hypothetical protein
MTQFSRPQWIPEDSKDAINVTAGKLCNLN